MPGVHVLSLYTLLLVNSLAPTIPHIHTQGQMHRNEKNEKKQRERDVLIPDLSFQFFTCGTFFVKSCGGADCLRA